MGLFVGEKCSDKFWPRIRLPRNSRDLLHAANLRHGTDGFTSPPKEGVLRIFSPLKIRRLQPGLNPRTWVPKASTLPLDHRSRILQLPSLIIRWVRIISLYFSYLGFDVGYCMIYFLMLVYLSWSGTPWYYTFWLLVLEIDMNCISSSYLYFSVSVCVWICFTLLWYMKLQVYNTRLSFQHMPHAGADSFFRIGLVAFFLLFYYKYYLC